MDGAYKRTLAANRLFLYPVQEKKGGGSKVGGVQGSTSSPTGIGSRQRMFEMLWNLECPIGLSQKKNMCAFQ